MDSCEKCQPGRYQPEPGKTFCVPCGTGFYQPVEAAHRCIACGVGKYGTQHGVASMLLSCKDCAAGRFNANTGASGCIECALGKYSASEGATAATACEHCEWGQYTDKTGLTACKRCTRGNFGEKQDGNQGLLVHCVQCPLGKFQQYDGSTKCELCSAGQYVSDVEQHTCTSCPRVDDLRYFWSEAGASECFAQKLDCKVSTWSTWNTCSLSCGSGTRTRARAPVPQLPCSLPGGIGCDQAWGVGARPCSEFANDDEELCNIQPCPIDCLLHPWQEWSTCTQSCGTGETHRSRVVAVPHEYGGKTCAHLHETMPCNSNLCGPLSLPRCHSQHIHCRVRQQLLTEGGGRGANRCFGQPWYYAYGNCHKCDSPSECDLKGIHHTLEVTHDKRYSALAGQQDMFHCSLGRFTTEAEVMSRTAPSCDCRCRMHPPCVAKRGVAVKGAALLGNIWRDVASRQACCDMCTNQPSCTSYTYSLSAADAGEGSGGVCALHGSEVPKFEEVAGVNTWSGCSHGHTCVGLDPPPSVDDGKTEFGMYDVSTMPPGGWQLMSAADFRSQRAAFRVAYNSAQGISLIKPFRSGNCCVAVSGGKMLAVTNTPYGFQFPSSVVDSELSCNPSDGYSAEAYRFYRLPRLTEDHSFESKDACSTNHNPAVYMRRHDVAVASSAAP